MDLDDQLKLGHLPLYERECRTCGQMKNLVDETNCAWMAIGKVNYQPTTNEKTSIKHRRSIYFSKNLKAGSIITKDNIKIVRPGFGLEPKYFDEILGRKVNCDVLQSTTVKWNVIQNN